MSERDNFFTVCANWARAETDCSRAETGLLVLNKENLPSLKDVEARYNAVCARSLLCESADTFIVPQYPICPGFKGNTAWEEEWDSEAGRIAHK